MSNASMTNDSVVPNAKRLLKAGSIAILATGVGAAVRGGILANWGHDFGFTATQLGAISGAGFTGFCFGIIIGGVLVDKIGYGKLVAVAFLAHILSAVVTFAATPANAYNFLTWGMFIFAYANGTLEAVANPLVATVFPKQRTHYLNILHAAWPGGLVLGSVVGWVLGDRMQLSWKLQLSVYLIPTIAYGLMFLGQKFPKSEAAEKGAKFSEMFKDVGILGALVISYLLALFFADTIGLGATAGNIIGGVLLLTVAIITKFSIGSFLLFILFVTHMLLGAVELGTDSWIQNITGNLFTSEQGKFLFIWTSAIMFGLRFCAHWVEKTLKLSPVGLLMICAVIACIGLRLTSGVQTFGMAMAALGLYAVGKTFFWPTMLAVASDRFPRSGAVAMSIMGGIGMLSAGMLGGPGLGYSKDRYAAEALANANPAAYAEVKVASPSKFLFFKEVNAIDGKKLADAKEAKTKDAKQTAIVAADQAGDRATLKADSYIPATMAVIYLCLFIYFKSIGGYKVLKLEEQVAS